MRHVCVQLVRMRAGWRVKGKQPGQRHCKARAHCYTHTHTHTHTHTCIHAYRHTHIHTHTGPKTLRSTCAMPIWSPALSSSLKTWSICSKCVSPCASRKVGFSATHSKLKPVWALRGQVRSGGAGGVGAAVEENGQCMLWSMHVGDRPPATSNSEGVREWEKERERKRGKKRECEREGESEGERKRGRGREGEGQRESESGRERQRERQRETHTYLA